MANKNNDNFYLMVLGFGFLAFIIYMAMREKSTQQQPAVTSGVGETPINNYVSREEFNKLIKSLQSKNGSEYAKGYEEV